MKYPIEYHNFAGVNRDLQASELPPDVYTYAQNMRYRDFSMERVRGHAKIFQTGQLHAPYFILGIRKPLDYYWIYPGETAIGVVDTTGTHSNITPGGGITAATYANNWTGGQINGVPYLSHPTQDPLYWDGTTGNPMQTLPGWPANTKAGVIRTYNNYLIALNLTESSVNYHNRIRWSVSAPAGTIPNSWDASDPTKDAGSIELAGTQGELIDCLPLYGDNIVYKDNSTFIMSVIGGFDIFGFRELFHESGILAKNCVCQFHGKHLVLTQDDIIIHDGQTQQSIIDKRLRQWLFNSIDFTNASKSFVAPYHQKKEIWICFADGSAGSNGLPNQALIWNYQDNQFGFRDLPAAAFIQPGVVSQFEGVSDWDSDTQAWNEDETIWNQDLVGSTSENLVMASGSNLYQVDITDQFDGVDYSSYIERLSLPLSDNLSEMKLLRALWLNIEGSDGEILKIGVGIQQYPDDPVYWYPDYDFTIGSDDRVLTFAKGRFLSFHISSMSGSVFKINRIGFEVKPSGRY